MKNITLLIAGVVFGYALVTVVTEASAEPKAKAAQEEVVYGHRIGPDGNLELVTKR